MKTSGANLLLIFAWGGLWCIGYLVTPYLDGKLPSEQIQLLPTLMVALAIPAFIVDLFARQRWKADQPRWSNVPLQANLAAIVLAIGYLLLSRWMPHLVPFIYGLLSLCGVIWVSFLKIE